MTNGSKGLKTAVLLSSKMESHQRRKFKEFGERGKSAILHVSPLHVSPLGVSHLPTCLLVASA